MKRSVALLLAALSLSAVDSTVKFENDFVRVLGVTYQPHDKSVLHAHVGNRVTILLNAGNLATIYEDGRREDIPWKVGEARWVPKGPKHIGENTGSNAVRIVEVELKKPAPAQPPQRDPKLDPVAIDPKHNVLLFENDQVRVFRSWREPGKKEMVHEHVGAGRVGVFLSDVFAKVESNGVETPLRASAGDVTWSGPVVHATTNLGKTNLEMIVVEVK